MVDRITTAALTPATNLLRPTGTSTAGLSGTGGQSFAELLKEVAGNSVQAGNRSEVLATKALVKEAELVDIVTAVSNAEMTLETVVAVRDRLIAAYQEIIKMPI